MNDHRVRIELRSLRSANLARILVLHRQALRFSPGASS
jgi:hypothetical protein